MVLPTREAARLAAATPCKPPPLRAAADVATATAVRRTASTARERSTRWYPSRQDSYPSVSRSAATWTPKSAIATRSSARRASGVRKTVGRKRGPRRATTTAATTPNRINSDSPLPAASAARALSSSAVCPAMSRVTAVPTPACTSESHPLTPDSVCSKAQVPKPEGPRPRSRRGKETSATIIAQPFPAPVARVLSSSRRRNGATGGFVALRRAPPSGSPEVSRGDPRSTYESYPTTR